MSSEKKIIVSDSVGKDLGGLISKLYSASEKKDGDFIIGLSGGSLPKFFASGLEEMSSLDWSRVKFIFCDERLVPYDDGESTWKAYKEALLGRVQGLEEKNFILVDVGLGSAEAAAKDYENKIRSYAANGFDLLLLGMGPDGHTCSLFPGHPLLNEQSALVAPISDSPKPPPSRVTLTLPAINKAKAVIFVSTGEGKKAMIENVVKKKLMEYPAARVQPESRELFWILDKGAAANL
eukprot:TRINITY_DN1822_c0_g1_i1.p1 TRINITY_DN1822_c0_g1~~TRINITY_DN1822_c0_g1_i1.p1  ORF type:complete len:236 (+),score=66.89 TRINITY_DN1822_c0_g1_i1:155-862(+)